MKKYLFKIVGMIVLGKAIAIVEKKLRHHLDTRNAKGEDIIDEASRESFPASDPPSWNAGR